MNPIEAWLKSTLFTNNTIRYRVEYARICDCLRKIGKVDSLFDGGAAGGEMVRRLLADHFCQKVTALEYDVSLLKKLRRNLGADARVKILQGSLTDVKLPDACVDLAMSTQVLEHIVDHEKAASELGRLAKPGGHILVSVPHPPERMPNSDHIRPGYTEEDLRDLFPEPQYTLLHTEYCLTLETQRRMIAAQELPLQGRFVPLFWVDRETHLSSEERKAADPYGITCLFRKNVFPAE